MRALRRWSRALTLLRRSALGLFGLAALLLLLALAMPFAESLSIAGLVLDDALAVASVVAFAAAGFALCLGPQAKWAFVPALAGTVLAASFLFGLRPPQGAQEMAGFILYLGATGAMAAAGLMAATSPIEERRHGPLVARTFRAATPMREPTDAREGQASAGGGPPETSHAEAKRQREPPRPPGGAQGGGRATTPAGPAQAPPAPTRLGPTNRL
jgi:hypothetical protein